MKEEHVLLVFASVALFAIIGLVATLNETNETTPIGYIDYFEAVDGCPGARLYTQTQVEGKSKYVDYKGETKDLYCYNYYSPIKRLGTAGEATPALGSCWQEKCCWREVPSYGVRHSSAPPEAFANLEERFRYSPVVAAQKGETIPEAELHKKIREICGVVIPHE